MLPSFTHHDLYLHYTQAVTANVKVEPMQFQANPYNLYLLICSHMINGCGPNLHSNGTVFHFFSITKPQLKSATSKGPMASLRQEYTTKIEKNNFLFYIFNKFFNSYIITVQNLVAIACFIAKI